MKTTQFLALLILLLSKGLPAAGQSSPVGGVVWQVPESAAQAENDLIRMRRMGIQAVRTSIIESDGLLQLADTLGLQLFQELPIRSLTAPRLVDTLDFAEEQLRRALGTARRHPSARHFGLTRRSDTSDSTACIVLDRLAELVRNLGPPGARSYYVTPFTERDRCGNNVDLVLLTAVGDEDPIERLRQWEAAHPEVPAGIAAVGTWVRRSAASGLRVKHSAEYQARYLENAIRALVEEGVSPFFLYRWRDVVAPEPSPALDLEEPYARNAGLLTLDNRPRPAYQVVEGLLTGRQTMFAFPQGEEQRESASRFVLLGWGVLLLLAIMYALSPRFRHMVPRYFGAHQFYRQAVREGREVLFGASVVMLTAVGVSAGMIVALFFEIFRTSDAFTLLVQWLPEGLQEMTLTFLLQPVGLVLFVGGVYALALVLWTALLSALSSGRYVLYPGQALMLVSWPLWPLLPAMVAAMVISTFEPETARLPSLILVLFWLVVTVGAMLRTLTDYLNVTRARAYAIVIGALFSPPFLGAVAMLVAWLRYRPEILFLWNLAQSG